MLCFLNGAILPQEAASISINDRGFLYGDSLFETVRGYAGRLPFLSRHLDRLERGMETLGFPVCPERRDIETSCLKLMQANDIDAGVIRIMLTRGCGNRGANPQGAHSPTLLITTSPLPADLHERMIRGYHLVISRWNKPSPKVLPAHIKSGNYLNSILAMHDAAQEQADEAVLLDQDGNIVECSQSSLFFVERDKLITSTDDSGALHGITRSVICELSRDVGISVEQRPMSVDVISAATEAFVANSVIGIIPAATIEARRYPVPGEVTALIQKSWMAVLRKNDQ